MILQPLGHRNFADLLVGLAECIPGRDVVIVRSVESAVVGLYTACAAPFDAAKVLDALVLARQTYRRVTGRAYQPVPYSPLNPFQNDFR